MKTPWIEPELIAIVRGDRQELILTTCKNASAFGSGPFDADRDCSDSVCEGYCNSANLS